ncbi:MAG: B12-binding domain-containing radical SAM protein [Peptococcaceae bacterium]|jgi:radical SAM superfamily enzyme YgiQ (UPF0313 family)|nr:B12-binding domain-containing radical SAM protein [Peptococcaceae bacterium]
MRILLAALNSQYVHTNLAVRSLAAACCGAGFARGSGMPPPEICEYHVNQQGHWILGDLLQRDPDIIGFSCYIWNIELVLRLAEDIKKTSPRIQILLGGPEVSFDAFDRMEKHGFIDYILCGEGEETLPLLLKGADRAGIPGLVYREGRAPAGSGEYRTVAGLETLAGPWTEESLALAKHQIVYYETSRGCPFSCEYCMSGSLGGGVRERPLARVQADLALMSACGTPLVKLADRTFNANPERAKSLLRWMLEFTGDMRIHLELAADLLDEEMLALLSHAPKGKIQIEAGIQSFNEETLRAVARKTDLAKLKQNVTALTRSGGAHVHLDLIAGLPYEDIGSFARSFDQAYALSPHHLQLGFLKLLKGSGLAAAAGRYGIQSRGYPPYEVLCTERLSAAEVLILKGIAELLDRYYNSGRAPRGLRFIIERGFTSAFEFYRRFYEFCHSRGYLSGPVSGLRQFEILIEFAERASEGFAADEFWVRFLVQLKLDYWAGGIRGRLPEAFVNPPFVRDESRIRAEARRLLAENRVTKRQFGRAVFDILPIHPINGTIQDTVVMADPDCRDEVTEQYALTVFEAL